MAARILFFNLAISVISYGRSVISRGSDWIFLRVWLFFKFSGARMSTMFLTVIE